PKLTSISRRRFAQLVGVGAVSAVARPSIAWPDEMMARSTVAARAAASAIVRLNSNENPYGPSPMAVKAMTDAFSLAWRYPDEHEGLLVDSLAKLNNVAAAQILLGNGSGEILKVAAAAFTAAGKKLVVGNPTFEAILAH